MQMVSAAPLARAALFGFALIGGVTFPSHTATQLTAARAPPHRAKAAVMLAERSMMRACNLVPDEQDGRVVGVKLYGIRRGSFLNRLGLHNGDSLRTINGFSLANADDALEAVYPNTPGAPGDTTQRQSSDKPSPARTDQ